MQVAITEQGCTGESYGHQLTYRKGKGGPANASEANGFDLRVGMGGTRNE